LYEEKEAAGKLRSLQDENTKQKQEAQEEAKLMKKKVLEIREKAIEMKANLYQEELKHAEDLFAEENSILCKAIKSKDFNEASVAQSLIRVAKNKIKAVRKDMEKLHDAWKSVATKTKMVSDGCSNVIKKIKK